MRIYIDIGHGEAGDPGAVRGQYKEHDMNIVTGNALAKRLTEHGHSIKVESGNLAINNSARAANAFGADYCISQHYNAGGGNRGEVIFSWDKTAEKLANAISIGLNNAGQTKVNVYRSKANSVGTAEFFGMLRIPTMPAVIIEPCFIDNAADIQLADTEAEQIKVGICIADAIALAYGSSLNDKYETAVNKLAEKGMTSSGGSYWRQFKQSTLYAKGNWVDGLIQKITSINDLRSAVNYLVNNGVLTSPDYWLQNCVMGEEVYGGYVQQLIIKSVEKLGL